MAAAREEERNLAIRTYGHRLFEGQTLPEYLIEFAQVFLADRPNSASDDLGGPGKFPTRLVGDEERREELPYRVHARIGLKRFIFFERSKQEKRLQIDERAYEKIRELLEARIECERGNVTPSEVVDIIQELFHGYNAVLLNRSWFAQSLWPISQELIFPEGMRDRHRGGSSRQVNTDELYLQGNDGVDGDFNFHSYLFQARGGEVYYLHVLSGLLKCPELREPVENGLLELFNSRPELSRLAAWVQETWEAYMGTERNRTIDKRCQWIPETYERRAPFTVKELACFLRAKMDPLQKIQLLSLGIVLQILRMMHDRAGKAVRESDVRPPWFVHIPGCSSQDVKNLAARSYQHCEDDLLGALYTKAEVKSGDALRESIAQAAPNAHLLFRKLGKAAELVVPPKGPNTRFSMSEDLLKFLVMALIEPGDKVLLSEFLTRLYEHFGFIIGPEQLTEYQQDSNQALVTAYDGSLLRENEEAFKEMLKACGFLRDLSDATAIVENPFGG